MASGFSLDDLVYASLDRVKHLDSLATFRVQRREARCNHTYDVLDSWLASSEAREQQETFQTQTTVAMRGNTPVGFIATRVKDIHPSHEGMLALGLSKPFPALWVVHLAVDQRFGGYGIGDELLSVFGISAGALVAQVTGCRFIYLDAVKPAIKFYQRNEFVLLAPEDSPKPALPMVFDLGRAPHETRKMSKDAQETLLTT